MSLLYDVIDNLEQRQGGQTDQPPAPTPKRKVRPIFLGTVLAASVGFGLYYQEREIPFHLAQPMWEKAQQQGGVITNDFKARWQGIEQYLRDLPLTSPWSTPLPVDVISGPDTAALMGSATLEQADPAMSDKTAKAEEATTAPQAFEAPTPAAAKTPSPSGVASTPQMAQIATPKSKKTQISEESTFQASDFTEEMAFDSSLSQSPTPPKKSAPPKAAKKTVADKPKRNENKRVAKKPTPAPEKRRANNSNPSLSISRNRDHSAKKLYNEALVLSQKGNTRAAIQKLEQVIAKDPTHYKAAIMASALLNDAGDYKASLDLIKQAQKVNPSLYPLQHQKALTLSQNGKVDEALAALQSSRPKSSKERLLNLHLMGSIHYQNQDYARSTAIFKKALRYFPQSQDLWLGLAKSLQASHQAAAAERAYSYLSNFEDLRPDIRAHLSARP